MLMLSQDLPNEKTESRTCKFDVKHNSTLGSFLILNLQVYQERGVNMILKVLENIDRSQIPYIHVTMVMCFSSTSERKRFSHNDGIDPLFYPTQSRTECSLWTGSLCSCL